MAENDKRSNEAITSLQYNARNKVLKVPKLQYKLTKDVLVPEKFKQYLLADYNDAIRILIFCSPDTESILENFDVYLSDGTFKASPLPFKQLYSIHGYNAETKKWFRYFLPFSRIKVQKPTK